MIREGKSIATDYCGVSLKRFVQISGKVIGILLIAAITFFGTKQVRAQSGIDVQSKAVVQFQQQITFGVEAKAQTPIQQVLIFIQDDTQGRPVQLNADGYGEYHLDTNQMVLRPFSFVRWRYQFTMSDGSILQSENFFVRYDDNRFTWQTLESGSIHVMWSQGDAAFGQSAMNATLSGLQAISAIVPPDLSQPVDIYIYSSQNDLPAHLSLSGETWLAGHADPSLGAVSVVIESGSDQNILMEQRLPHELMHVMLYRHVGAGYSNLPAWLREGMAMLVELYPNPEYDRTLSDASANNKLIPIKELCASFSTNSVDAFLAYAESRSFTNYLRSVYGSTGLVNLANTYANGVDCEHGVERTFNVSLAKLELDWRTSVLGENAIGSSIQNLLPYLVLLCLVIFVPFIGIIRSMQIKGKTK